MCKDKEEMLQMTQRDLDRLKVLQQSIRKKLTQAKAGSLLGLSRGHINRLCQKIKKKGDKAIIHGLRGHLSNNQFPEDLANKAIDKIKERYADFGPTLASEKLSLDGICISVEKIRQLMICEGIWHDKKRRAQHREWRDRKDCPGEMVQMDGSDHDWFEDRRKKCILLATIDDANNNVFLRFTESESTVELMHFSRTYIEKFGRPISFYVDKDSIYKTNREPNLDEELKGIESLTQFTRAMEEDLGIKVINAGSPQAKGRVERLFGTLQDRLVKELRLAGISTIEEANKFLDNTYLEFHNKRFGILPKNSTNAHRLLNKTKKELDSIFCIKEKRVLFNDYTVKWKNRLFQVEEHQPFYLLPRTRVTIEEHLDKTIKIEYKDRYLNFHEIDSNKIRKPCADKITALIAKMPSKKVYKPPKNHPWRKSFKNWCKIRQTKNSKIDPQVKQTIERAFGGLITFTT